MNLSFVTIALLLFTTTAKAENSSQIPEWMPSSVKLVNTTTEKITDMMRIRGKIHDAYSDDLLKRPVIISINGIARDTIKNGTFDLFIIEGEEAIESMTFNCYQYSYEPATTGKIKFKKNQSREYKVVLAEYLIEAEKPVVYLYPLVPTDLNINLNVNGKLNFTYPEYKNGWSVKADPNGTLKIDDKAYDYLFYDAGITPEAYHSHEGFVVEGKDVVEFLESSLTTIGLNTSERNDFITYWAPRMVKNDFNHVQFLTGDEYNQISEINVSPKPETSIRLFMFFKNTKANHVVTNTTLPSYERKGFTLVEWGGSEVKTDKTEL